MALFGLKRQMPLNLRYKKIDYKVFLTMSFHWSVQVHFLNSWIVTLVL